MEQIYDELLSSQEIYVKKLIFLQHNYIRPIQDAQKAAKPLLSKTEYQKLSLFLPTLDAILKLDSQFLEDLKKSQRDKYVDTIRHHVLLLKLYSQYWKELNSSLDALSNLQKSNDGFAALTKTLHEAGVAAFPSSVNSSESFSGYIALFSLPLERVKYLKEKVLDLTKASKSASSDHDGLVKVGEELSKLSALIEDLVKFAERKLALETLQREWGVSHFVDLNRINKKVLLEGNLDKVTRSSVVPYRFVLFTDSLAYGVPQGKKDARRVKHHTTLPLHSIVVENSKLNQLGKRDPKALRAVRALAGEEEPEKDLDPESRSFFVLSSHKSFKVYAATLGEATAWTDAIRRAIVDLYGAGSKDDVDALPSYPPPSELLKPVWVPNVLSKGCMKCGAGFTLLRRRHHCRLCGMLVCQACSRKRVVVEGEKLRVCDDCGKQRPSVRFSIGYVNPFALKEEEDEDDTPDSRVRGSVQSSDSSSLPVLELRHSVGSAAPVAAEEELLRCVCVAPQTGERREGEMAVAEGDVVLVEEIETGWATGVNERTREYGACETCLLALEKDRTALPLVYNAPEETASTPVGDYLVELRKSEDKRSRVMHEVVSTERTYLSGLLLLLRMFLRPLLADFRSGKNLLGGEVLGRVDPGSGNAVSSFVQNVENIAMLNSNLLKELEELVATAWHPDRATVGDVFIKYAPLLKIYDEFSSSYEFASKALSDEPKLTRFLEEQAEQPKLHGVSFLSLLITPIQRIPRYLLLLKEMLKHTPPEHPDRALLGSAIADLEGAAVHINEHIRERENTVALREIDMEFKNRERFSQNRERTFVHRGDLVKHSRKKDEDYTFVLFSDMLIYFNRKKTKPPRRMRLEHLALVDKEGCAFELVMDGGDGAQEVEGEVWVNKSFRVTARSESDKKRWMTFISDALVAAKDERRAREGGQRRFQQISRMLEGDSSAERRGSGEVVPVWQQDTKNCERCGAGFSFLFRRHHCRNCGRCVCGKCSTNRIVLAHVDAAKELRVCDDCFAERERGDVGENVTKTRRAGGVSVLPQEMVRRNSSGEIRRRLSREAQESVSSSASSPTHRRSGSQREGSASLVKSALSSLLKPKRGQGEWEEDADATNRSFNASAAALAAQVAFQAKRKKEKEEEVEPAVEPEEPEWMVRLRERRREKEKEGAKEKQEEPPKEQKKRTPPPLPKFVRPPPQKEEEEEEEIADLTSASPPPLPPLPLLLESPKFSPPPPPIELIQSSAKPLPPRPGKAEVVRDDDYDIL